LKLELLPEPEVFESLFKIFFQNEGCWIGGARYSDSLGVKCALHADTSLRHFSMRPGDLGIGSRICRID